jgi:hypothetical protein
VTGDQLDVQWRRDQLVVMARLGVGPLAQPVTRRTTGAHANDNQAGQTTEYLATGKRHELNYLTNQQQAQGLQKGEYDTPAIAKQ